MHPALVVAGLSLLTQKSTSRVGAVQWDDPNAPPAELAKLLPKEPKVLTNPNLDPQELLKYVGQYPLQVSQNPALPLIQLEDPALYQKIRDKMVQGLLEGWSPDLSFHKRALLTFLELSRVLPLFEKTNPQLPTPRNVLGDIGDYLSGGITPKDLSKASAKINQLGHTFPLSVDENPSEVYCRAIQSFLSALLLPQRTSTQQGLASMTIAQAIDLSANAKGMYLGKSTQEKFQIAKEEKQWIADQVITHLESQDKRQETYNNIQKQIAANAFREAYYGEEIRKEEEMRQKIADAVAQAKDGAKQCAKIMASEETKGWPMWIGLGVLGVSAALILGPTVVLATGLTEGVSATVAATEAAEAIVTAAEAADVSTVSVQAFIDGAEIAETDIGEDFLAELAAKLRGEGITLVDEVAEAVARAAQ